MNHSMQCSHEDRAEIDAAILMKLGLSCPDIHLYALPMAQLATEIHRRNQEHFCILPFCHTVEGSALGANITYDTPASIPVPGASKCKTVQELLPLFPMNLSNGRIPQVIEACRLLSHRGKSVLLNINGPLTTLNTLMDTMDLLSLLAENPPQLSVILSGLMDGLLEYIRLAANAGTEIISYADAISSPDILGPNLAQQLSERFTIPLLTAAQQILCLSSTVLILCPKTAQALPYGSTIRREEPTTMEQASKTSSILAGPCVKHLQRQTRLSYSPLIFF